MPAQEAMDWLTVSPGIGTKTAAVLLLFAFGKPLFPVDTHIRRVAGRVGFVAEGTSAEKVQEAFARLVPASAAGCAQLHLDLIRLGRQLCHPHEPECPACPLLGVCRHARRRRVRPASAAVRP
jgi:endonuclease-3